MPYALRFDGVNDTVTITTGMTGNVGTSLYTMRIKSGPAGITLPSTGLAGFIGVTGAAQSNGLVVNNTGQIRIYQAGTNRYGSTSQLIFTGTAFDYTLTHNADGTWNIFNNLTSSATGESGTFTGNNAWTGGTALNQFGRSSNGNTVYLQGDIALIEVTGLANSESWQADLSGGAGTTLPTGSGNNQGTLNNFTVPDCWIFYSTGVAFEGTLGKTSLTATAKALAVSAGWQSSVVKSNYIVSLKQLALTLGYVNVLSKNAYNTTLKQLSVTVGTNISFTGLLGKNAYTVSSKALSVNAGASISTGKQSIVLLPKPLTVSSGWSAGVQKQSLTLTGKQEGVSIGHLLSINEQHLTIQNKQLQLVTGTSVSFLGELNKTALNLSPKQLGVLAGTAIPLEVTLNKSSLILTPKQLGIITGTSQAFSGTLAKTSYNLSGKTLSNVAGTVLTLQKQALQIVSKQLSMGEAVYPIVPIERVFTLTDKNNRTYVFKQTTHVYVMDNKQNTFNLSN
jgi:hypothetical protein